MALDFAHACLSWARTMRADQEYDYDSVRSCAVAQFIRDTGRCPDPMVWRNMWSDRKLRPNQPWHEFDPRIVAAAETRPHTFGSFADRLERELAK